MPPAIAAAGIGAAGAIGSGILANNAASDAADRQSALAADQAALFNQIADPDYANMNLDFQKLIQQGEINPILEQLVSQDPSAMANVNVDPRLLKAQQDALSTLANISNEGGMDPQAMLAFRQAQQGAQSAARGAREANLQNAAARGASGSGLEFVSNQMADQNAANQAEMAGLTQAAAANGRDLDALKQYASLANTMGQQDVGLQSAKAAAEDARNKFNATLRGDTQQRNVGALNTANAANLGERQRVSDQNVAIANQQQQYNKQLPQQKFQNDLAKAQGAAGQTASQINAIGNQGQAASNLWAGIGQGLSGGASAIGNYYAGQEKDDKYLNALKALKG